MNPVLFLDFDGVLHPEPSNRKDTFTQLPLVENILREFPTVEIVISSAWRLDWWESPKAVAVENLRRHFSADIAQRVVGVTPLIKRTSEEQAWNEDFGPRREIECLAWLRANRPPGTPWLALDDREWWFSPESRNLMKVDGDTGFLPSDEDRFRSQLARIASPPTDQVPAYITVFLDFDGVLHPEPCSKEDRFTRRDLVQNVLREFPHVEIVLSTSWRLKYPHDPTGENLKHLYLPGLLKSIVGVTPSYKDLDSNQAPDGITLYPREWECLAWLRANRPYSQWIALDDKAYLFRPFNKHLMVIDAATGFTHNDQRRLRKLLNSLSKSKP